MPINYTELAVSDLGKVFEFIASDNKKTALEYLSKIKSKIELLAVSPDMGVTCRSKNIDSHCRVLIYENYLIFYKVDNFSILILRVIHSSVDYQKLLAST